MSKVEKVELGSATTEEDRKALEKIAKELSDVPDYYTDTPHLDTYIVTVKIPVTFARENDQVSNVSEAKAWLQRGDILESNDGTYEIIKVEKKGGD